MAPGTEAVLPRIVIDKKKKSDNVELRMAPGVEGGVGDERLQLTTPVGRVGRPPVIISSRDDSDEDSTEAPGAFNVPGIGERGNANILAARGSYQSHAQDTWAPPNDTTAAPEYVTTAHLVDESDMKVGEQERQKIRREAAEQIIRKERKSCICACVSIVIVVVAAIAILVRFYLWLLQLQS
jgi:hypothetical protein